MSTHRRQLQVLRLRDTNFDSGGALSVVDEGGYIRIAPNLGKDSKWAEFAFRSDRLAGATPHFLIAKSARLAAPAENENLAVWARAADTDTWTNFTTQTVGATDIEFYNDYPFPSGPIYIAHVPMYPVSRIDRLAREWRKDARVTFTSIGQAARRVAQSNRIAPGLPFYSLTLTNANANTKNNMVLCARSHGNETQGSFQLEGALAWLLAGSNEAEFLLDWFNVIIYPATNPQGVHECYHRSQPENVAVDHNRAWDTDALECTTAFRAAINTATGGDVDVGFDFHGSVGADRTYGMLTDNTTALAVAYEAEMDAYDASYYDNASNLPESCKAYLETLSADLSNGQEGGLLNTFGITGWKNSGQYAMRSITNMHADGKWTNGPGIGSRDFNGSTDRIDWAAVYNLTASPLTISAWINSDGQAGNSDFIFEIHQSGDAAIGMQLYLASATSIYFQRGTGATSIYRGAVVSSVSSALHHVLIIHDGTVNDYTTIHIYLDGVEETTVAAGQNGSSLPNPTGSWSVGGRIYDDTRNFDGKISQVGVWNRVLTSTEIADLAAGYAPDLAAASGLQFYFKGNTSSLVAVPPTSTGTADGTTSVTGVGNGPSVIYG